MPDENKWDWSRVRKLLCIRLDALGDVLMTGPALQAIKESQPQSNITLWTSPAGAQAAGLLAEVDQCLIHEAPWMKRMSGGSISANSQTEWKLIRELKDRGFDAAIIFTVYSQSPLPAALLCYLSDIPFRLAHCRENPYQLLTHWVQEKEPLQTIRHEVQRQLDLVSTVGCRPKFDHLARPLAGPLTHPFTKKTRIQIPTQSLAQARSALDSLKIDLNKPWALIHPGATAPSRRYDPSAYAEVAEQLIRNFGWQVIFTGNASEKPLIEEIQSKLNTSSYSLAGKLSIVELAALISLAPLLIANNTGPVHIASSVGTPVVVLYALTNPQHTPWRVPNRVLFHDVSCRYCYKSACPEKHQNCLNLVKPDQVVQAAVDLLSGNGTHDSDDTKLCTP